MADIFERLKVGIVCETLEETFAVAKEFVGVIGTDCSIALSGDLGTGKTAFVKGLGKALSISQTIKSPSFNICCVYDVPDGRKFVHIDAYRFTNPELFEDLLIDEIAPSPRIVCVEWAEMAQGYFEPDYWLELDIKNGAHIIKLRE